MMRTLSERALSVGRECLNEVIARGDSATTVAEELFSVADILLSQGALRRSLTDPSRSERDRVGLAEDLFKQKLTNPSLAVLSALVGQSWSSDQDLPQAFNALGVEALIVAAIHLDSLERVQQELGAIRNTLRDSRDLRLALSPASRYLTEQRVALVEQLFTDRICQPTLRLLIRMIERPRHASLLQALDQVASAVAHARNRRLVRVTSAAPLTDEQVSRLRTILTKKYGPITINTAVNPNFLGGMRVRIGTDAIEGTLQADIASAKQRLGR